MNEQFLLNLAAVLAHSAVYEAQLPGIPPGTFRNDLGTSYSTPNQGQVASDTMLAEMQAMEGTGPFATTGSLPNLIKQNAPAYEQISLQNTSDYLNGVNGTPGMLSLYQNSVQPAMAAMQQNQAASNINTVNALGPQALAAIRNYNPQVTGTLDTVNNQAQQQLNLNGALDPFTKTMMGQDIQQQQASRGLGTGYGDAAATAFYQDSMRQQLRQQNQNQALRVASQTAGYYGDPFSTVLNGTNPSATMSAYGAGQGGGASAASPVTGAFSLSNPLVGMAYGAQNQANQYGATAQNDLMGGLLTGGFGILAGLGSGTAAGMAACWAARAIFGAANPKWLQFRQWLLTDAPAKLRTWYLAHGPEWAERIGRMSPEGRSAIRRWMLGKLTALTALTASEPLLTNKEAI